MAYFTEDEPTGKIALGETVSYEQVYPGATYISGSIHHVKLTGLDSNTTYSFTYALHMNHGLVLRTLLEFPDLFFTQETMPCSWVRLSSAPSGVIETVPYELIWMRHA